MTDLTQTADGISQPAAQVTPPAPQAVETPKPLTTLERLESVEQNVEKLLEHVGSNAGVKLHESVNAANQMSELAAQRMLALEQTVAALAKTIAATIKSLHVGGLLDQASIMGNIRHMDDEADQEKLTKLLNMKALTEAAVVSPTSIVVVAQNYIDTTNPSKSRMIRACSLVELPMPMINPQLRKDLQGRKVGETLPAGKDDNGVYTMTIQKIYNIVEPKQGTQPGEDPAAADSTAQVVAEITAHMVAASAETPASPAAEPNTVPTAGTDVPPAPISTPSA